MPFIQLPCKDCPQVSLCDRQEESENSELEKRLLQRLNVFSDARVQPIDSLTYTRLHSGFPPYLLPSTVSYTNKKEKKTSVALSYAPPSCCISTTTPISPFSSLVLYPSPSFRITFLLTKVQQRHLHVFLLGWIESYSVALVSVKMRQKLCWHWWTSYCVNMKFKIT